MPRGGKRAHAGRPVGTGKYQETTKLMRVPLSRVDTIQRLLAKQPIAIPLFTSKIAAGFPSPADDYAETTLSLDEHLVQHPAATFCLRVTGDSMIDIGIFPNDLLIVDRSIAPQSGHIVVAAIEGDFTVKRLLKTGEKYCLMPENKKYAPIQIQHEEELVIWGVVIHSVRNFNKA